LKCSFLWEMKPLRTGEETHTRDQMTRRELAQTAAGAALSLPLVNELAAPLTAAAPENTTPVSLRINGTEHKLRLDPRVTLLDLLRERLALSGTKKGCDHGQCGACTVLVNGRRINSCLSLAVCHEGDEVTTVEGIAAGGSLHPVQAAFIEHDGFQCGYCTPGQICSAVALMNEAKNGEASYVSENIRQKPRVLKLSDDEIRERMSGNICRCGAYPNILAAIREVHTGEETANTWEFHKEDKEDATV